MRVIARRLVAIVAITLATFAATHSANMPHLAAGIIDFRATPTQASPDAGIIDF